MNSYNKTEFNEKQLARMQQICESYIDNKERLAMLDTRLEDCQRLKANAKKQYDVKLIEEAEEKVIADRKRVWEDVFFFERAMSVIGGRTALVLTQLYDERQPWDNIGDSEGNLLSSSTISRERWSGFHKMAEIYYAEAREVEVDGSKWN